MTTKHDVYKIYTKCSALEGHNFIVNLKTLYPTNLGFPNWEFRGWPPY